MPLNKSNFGFPLKEWNSIQDLAHDLVKGQRRALSKAITLIESTRSDQQDSANELVLELYKRKPSQSSVRIGISGPPGVGKSTFIEAFGKHLLAQGKRLAVLAVDPTSPISGGSILGDKTRMPELSSHTHAFVRPSPSSGSLGGVARRTREAILLCEAAGYDVILVETVGVGQSEVLVSSMVDLFLILQLPNAGDELQGIKKGILELADLIAVTKSDSGHEGDAKLAKSQLESALKMVRSQEESHLPEVILTSAITGKGIMDVWTKVQDFIKNQTTSGRFKHKRQNQSKLWFESELGEMLKDALLAQKSIAKLYGDTLRKVEQGELPASYGARLVVAQLIKNFQA